MNVFGFGMNQIWKNKISYPSKQINNNLIGTIKICYAYFFCDISNAEHAFGHIPLVPEREM
jgi:hypothetical protein